MAECCTSVVFVTGPGSGVGKTWFAERLVKYLRGRGLRVAAVKHVHHGVDYRVKDTGRLLEAGAERVVALGPRELMVVERRSLSLEAILHMLCGFDTVVVEGFRELAPRLRQRGACVVYMGDDAPEWAIRAWVGGEDVVRRVASIVADGGCRTCLGGGESSI